MSCALPGRVLLHRDQRRHAAALEVRASHEVSGALGGDHGHVDVGRRLDQVEADVEAVREEQALAGRQVRRDLGVVGALLFGVGHEDHDDVGLGAGVGDGEDAQSRVLGLGDRRGVGAQSHAHVVAAVVQVERVRVALGAVAEDRDLLGHQEFGFGVNFVVHRGHGESFVVYCWSLCAQPSLGSATRPVRWSSTSVKTSRARSSSSHAAGVPASITVTDVGPTSMIEAPAFVIVSSMAGRCL